MPSSSRSGVLEDCLKVVNGNFHAHVFRLAGDRDEAKLVCFLQVCLEGHGSVADGGVHLNVAANGESQGFEGLQNHQQSFGRADGFGLVDWPCK